MDRRRWILVAILVAFLGTAAGAWVAWTTWRPSRRIEPPALNLAGADPAVREAVLAAAARVRRTPGDADAWGELGMSLLAHEIFQPAAACLAQAAALDPHNARWPYLEALALLKGDPRPSEALASLERAAELSGAEPAPRLQLAELLLAEGRGEAAEAEFRRVAGVDARNARAQVGLGRAAYLRGDLKTAREHLVRARNLEPTVRATRALLAEVLHRLGEAAAAEEEGRAAARLLESHRWPDPFWQAVIERTVGSMARVERAADLFQRQRVPEALAHLRRTAVEYPRDLLVHLALGRFLIQAGSAAEAETVLRGAVEMAPQAFEAHFELASALASQGKEGQAAAEFQETIAIRPDYAPAHYNLGRLLWRRGMTEEALRAFRGAVRAKPDYAAAHRDLGALLLVLGERDAGAAELRLALQLDPHDREAARLMEKAER